MSFQTTAPAMSRQPASPLRRILGALTWPLTPDAFIESLLPQAPVAARGRVERIEPNGPDAATITIRCPRGWRGHRAGQFVNVGVDVDGVRHTRCYSISSAPERGDGRFTITVKAIANGRVSRHLVQALEVGDTLSLGEPTGEFVLPAVLPERLLMIAAGSGITPIMSMLESLQAQDRLGDVVLIHSAPLPGTMIFGAALERMAQRHSGLTLQRYYTRHGGDTHQPGEHNGRFDAGQLDTLCPDWRERATWACGPDALLQNLELHFERAGVAEHLHVERFRPRLRPGAAADAETAQVTFGRSAVRACGNGAQSLLELAEASGLNPEHGCRMGICHGCTATLQSGRVRDLRSGEIHDEAGDLVQVCVCAPVGDVEIDL